MKSNQDAVMEGKMFMAERSATISFGHINVLVLLNSLV